MLIEIRALQQELPGLKGVETPMLCELLASLGFPVDGVDVVAGSTILDVDITANRGDAMSHRGMARDLAARLNAGLTPIPVPPLKEGEPLRAVRLEAVEACPFYATAVLELGAAQGTPLETRDFLAAMGATAKDLPPVDASNELLFRYGHPTHAFDLDLLKGDVSVRWAREGERLVTLDGVERRLSGKDLVIADESGPVALAGLMGGEASKVSAGTRRVLLESAYFDPRTVRAAAHRHGLHSDASQRFGRGADPAMAKVARDLLVQRLTAWSGGKLLSAWSVGRLPAASAPIPVNREMLARVAGEEIRMAETETLLKRLGCAVTAEPGCLHVVPPTWRHDLALPEDLAEEVLRLRGYDRIPAALPPLEGPPEPLAPSYQHRRALARRLAHLGFHQTVTLGFISPEMDASCAVPAAGDAELRTLANPLGQDYSVLRASLLPSLKVVAENNLRQGAREVSLFEIAPVHSAGAGKLRESYAVALVWGGERVLDGLLTQRKLRPVHPADLLGIARDLGFQGTPAVLELGNGLHGLEMPLESLSAAQGRIIPVFQPFSRLMSVERDLSLLVDLDQSYAALRDAMTQALPAEYLGQGPTLVDIFRHRSLPVGKQAWLFKMTFQAPDRTLKGEEVDGWVNRALEAARSLGAELRG